MRENTHERGTRDNPNLLENFAHIIHNGVTSPFRENFRAAIRALCHTPRHARC